MRIEWTDPALDDLEVIRDFIAKDSPYYARSFLERIFDAVGKLGDFPKRGRRVPEAERQDVRELILQGYRIIYLVEPDKLKVLAVIHGSQNLAGKKTKPWKGK